MGARKLLARRRRMRVINRVNHWRCSHCKEWLTEGQFGRSAEAASGLQSQCLKCSSLASAAAKIPDRRERARLKEQQRFQQALERQKRNQERYQEQKKGTDEISRKIYSV